jgi:hypothetical protein
MSGELTVRRADLGRSEPPRWAWSERIVLGYLNLLIGNEGVGKGTLIAWLIARLTRGELPGDLYGEPAGAAVIGDEDSFDGVWTPRLYAAGADLARVVQVERPDGGFVNLREDRDQLAAVVKGEGLAVLYFDQLLDNLGVEVDDWRTKQVREALQPLRAIARELNIAALGSLHPNKRGDSFRQLVSGAVAFNAVSRSSLLLAHHPDDQTRRVAVVAKGNLARRPASVEFVLAEQSFAANGFNFTVPVARDFGVGELTADDLIGAAAATVEHSKVRDATEIIAALLPRDGEWHPVKPILEACAAEQIDERTAQRAKDRLRIAHTRSGTFPAASLWRWPSPDAHTTSASTVGSVGSVASANGRNPLQTGSPDTHDTHDSENTCRERVASDADDELARIVAKFPDLNLEAAA